MYKYFISYNYAYGNIFTGDKGVGNGFVISMKPYTTMDDIIELQRQIEKEFGHPKGSVLIINFILVDETAVETADETEFKA